MYIVDNGNVGNLPYNGMYEQQSTKNSILLIFILRSYFWKKKEG